MSALFEIAYLSDHELFIRLKKCRGGDWRMRRKNIQKCMLEILGLRNAFIVNANNSPGQLYFDFFFLYVALRANIVHFGI